MNYFFGDCATKKITNCFYSRIMTVTSADEFYSIMGVLTREMLEFTDTNNLIKVEYNYSKFNNDNIIQPEDCILFKSFLFL